MKIISAFYNPASNNKKQPLISVVSLLSWITVLFVIAIFWLGIAVVYKRDTIPHTIAKIEHKEMKFLASHKALHKRITGIRSLV